MELAEVILAIIFSGLLIVTLLSVFFFYKNKLQRLKTIKMSVADIKLEPVKSAEPEKLTEPAESFPVIKSIEEKTFGRYKFVELNDLVSMSRDNEKLLCNEPLVSETMQNNFSQIKIKCASGKFSRLERVI